MMNDIVLASICFCLFFFGTMAGFLLVLRYLSKL